jgi:hypothetical protein
MISPVNLSFHSVSKKKKSLMKQSILFQDVLPELRDLKLSLINLEKLWQGPVLDIPSSYQNSTSLIVDACGRLKHVFSPSMVASLEKLKNLEICNCKAVEEIAVAC